MFVPNTRALNQIRNMIDCRLKMTIRMSYHSDVNLTIEFTRANLTVSRLTRNVVMACDTYIHQTADKPGKSFGLAI